MLENDVRKNANDLMLRSSEFSANSIFLRFSQKANALNPMITTCCGIVILSIPDPRKDSVSIICSSEFFGN